MSKFLEFLKHNWLRMLIALIVGIIITIVYLIAYQNAEKTNTWNQLCYYRDGTFIAGMVLVCIGGLTVVGQFGIFDIFSYYPGRKKKEDGHKENYGEYVERKRMERSHSNLFFLSYFIIGSIYLIFSIVCYFVLL